MSIGHVQLNTFVAIPNFKIFFIVLRYLESPSLAKEIVLTPILANSDFKKFQRLFTDEASNLQSVGITPTTKHGVPVKQLFL
jgi:hypothetical protein